MKCSVLPSRLKRKYRWFHPDTVKLILDDPDLYKCFQKEMDKRRRPPIAAFVSARLSGVSISAMDKLRFSTIWTPEVHDDDDDDDADGDDADDDDDLDGTSLSKKLRKQGKKAKALRESYDDEEWDPDGGDDRFDYGFTEEEEKTIKERRSSGAKKPKKKWQEGGEDDSWVPGDD